MSYKLYYRADTRPPEEIFSYGFQPRTNYALTFSSTEKPWWMGGLRYYSYYGYLPVFPDDFLKYWLLNTQTMDANADNVISMSTEFETTPIFPIDQTKEVYVYIMALPEATIPEHIGSGKIYDKIDVFDLHALQVRQAQDIIKLKPKENPGFVAQGLCAYEAFAQKIEPSQIIGVVKCKRSGLLYNTAGAEVFPSTHGGAFSFSRWFQVQDKFTCNSNFRGDSQLVDKAIEQVRMVKANGTQFTNKVLDALQESDIEYDPKNLITTTFFWHELSHLNFLSAISSVIVSIQYFFSLVYHYVTSHDNGILTVEIKDTKPTGLLPQLSIFGYGSASSQHQFEGDTLPEMAAQM